MQDQHQYQELQYTINKGVNRPIEFRGLQAQYIYYLAIGLAAILVLFCVLYISGTPVYICLPLVMAVGGGLFMLVTRLSHRYGPYGLMKAFAARRLPGSLSPSAITTIGLFRELNILTAKEC